MSNKDKPTKIPSHIDAVEHTMESKPKKVKKDAKER